MRKSRNVYVCTGPLYLPRENDNGELRVKYKVIGRAADVNVPTGDGRIPKTGGVSVPTDFFKGKVLFLRT